MDYKILIVGTVPYNEKSTSRAFDSYFHFYDKKKLAQIFSNTKKPEKGHCEQLFQITDQRMLKRWFNKNIETGRLYYYNELLSIGDENNLNKSNIFIKKLYEIGSKKNSFIYLMRGVLWKKKYWCTEKLNKWLDNFKPDCVFLAFSDDFFILKIGLYVAKKYDIPIISCIGDDYYFNYQKKCSPLYNVYKILYRKIVRDVFNHQGSSIYIGDKIRDKYNKEFNLKGETVYLSSSIKRKDFKPIDKKNLKISYFGNIRIGRNKSLNDIGFAISKINKNYILDIFSDEEQAEFYAIFKNNLNIRFHGSISYSEVQKRILDSDIVIVVEGFDKVDVNISRYSLSTKVADSLASGTNVLAYGSIECGAIEYAKQVGCVTVCTKKEDLIDNINRLINDVEYQYKNYKKAIEVIRRNHTLEKSTQIFKNIVYREINNYRRKNAE